MVELARRGGKDVLVQFERAGIVLARGSSPSVIASVCCEAVWKVLRRYIRNVLLRHLSLFLIKESENPARCRRFAAVTRNE